MTRERKGFVIDLNRVAVKEFAAMQKALASGDANDVAPWLARVMLKWPYSGNPSEVESYLNLGLADYMKVIAEFGNTIKRLSESMDEETTADSSS